MPQSGKRGKWIFGWVDGLLFPELRYQISVNNSLVLLRALFS